MDHDSLEKVERQAPISPDKKEDEAINAEEIKELRAIRTIIERQEFFSGPLPPPDVLKRYGEVVPDAPRTIINWASREQNARINNKYLGKLCALVYGLAVCGVSAYFGSLGHPWAASAIVALNVAPVCAAFLKINKDE